MLIKSVTILGLVALASAGTIQQRNIPVEVRYDEPAVASVRNLDDKVQLTETEVKEAGNALKEEAEDKPEETTGTEEPKPNLVRNLDEKVQLSPEELNHALKHLPVQPYEDLAVAESAPLKTLDGTPQIEEITKEPNTFSLEGVLQQAEDIIAGGLKKLRVSFKPDNDHKGPNTEQWDDLEKTVNEYLNEEKTKLQLKQEQPTPPSNQNFFQNLASGFQTIANNFIQNIAAGQPSNVNNTNQGDEQQGGGNQGPFQSFVNYFQGGINNIANAINNLGNQGSTTTSTVLGDTGTGSTTPAPGFISTFVNNVQQFFGQLQGGAQGGGSPGTQGDTGVNNTVSNGPPRPGQVIQSIGSAISNFIQGGPRPQNVSGDEGTATATTQSSNIIQSIGSAIQNNPFNPFRPQGQKPEEGAASTQNPIQAGISGIQNIGNQIQQLVPGQGSTTEAAKKPEDEAPAAENSQAPESSSQGTTKGLVTEEMENTEEMKQEEVKEENKQEEIKEEETKQEEPKQEEVKQEEPVQEVLEEQKPVQEMEQIKPVHEDMEPLEEEKLEEPVKQETKPEEMKEQKEEILMTVE